MIDLTRIIHDAADVACPGACVSIGSFDDKSTWRLNPPDGATQQQIDAANAAMQQVAVSQAGQNLADKRQQKASLRGRDMRVLRAVAKVLVKKIPGYNWQQFLVDFDAIIDAD